MRIFLTNLFILISIINYAQALTPIVICSGGANYNNSQINLAVTIGELTSVQTVSNNSINLILTQGFQQNQNLNALPLNLIDFKNKKVGINNQLKWSVQSEINIISYFIQKSRDGRNFKNFDTVIAKNNSLIETSYSVIDSQVDVGNVYYRLQINELDGSKWYSWILSFNDNINRIKVYPTPFDKNFFIELSQSKKEIKEFKVIDILGRTVWAKTYYLEQGINKLNIDFSTQNTGVYFLSGLGKEIIQIIKN